MSQFSGNLWVRLQSIRIQTPDRLYSGSGYVATVVLYPNFCLLQFNYCQIYLSTLHSFHLQFVCLKRTKLPFLANISEQKKQIRCRVQVFLVLRKAVATMDFAFFSSSSHLKLFRALIPNLQAYCLLLWAVGRQSCV